MEGVQAGRQGSNVSLGPHTLPDLEGGGVGGSGGKSRSSSS